MDAYTAGGSLEGRIIGVAREVFIEKGYEEASMSDIAARVGINRPTLHYYFRTKDKLFQTVLRGIIESLLPQIQGVILRGGASVEERVGEIVDIYFELLGGTPCMPLFVMREANRDASFLVSAIREFNLEHLFLGVRDALLAEMDAGRLRRVPCRFVFLTFYGLTIMPFMSKGICNAMFLFEGETFEDMLSKWKANVVGQMAALLTP